jgi:hypothetical protein
MLAQQVSVSADARTVKGGACEGFVTSLDGSNASVSQAFIRYLRQYGKVKTSDGEITVTNPMLGGNVYEKHIMYAVVKGDEKSATAWMGLNKSEWPENDTEVLLARIKDLTYQFGIKYYRDLVQVEIDETQQAVDAIERKVARLIQQNKDLNSKLLNNEQDKVRLEKALEQNATDHATLLLKIEANKKSQDSVAAAGVQVRKVLEARREKQSKIN